LFGNPLLLGGYHTYMYVGNPGQKMEVLIDTGSNLLAIRSTECK